MPKIGYLSMYSLLSKIILLVFILVLLYILEFGIEVPVTVLYCVGQTDTFPDHKYMYCSKRTMYVINSFFFFLNSINLKFQNDKRIFMACDFVT